MSPYHWTYAQILSPSSQLLCLFPYCISPEMADEKAWLTWTSSLQFGCSMLLLCLMFSVECSPMTKRHSHCVTAPIDPSTYLVLIDFFISVIESSSFQAPNQLGYSPQSMSPYIFFPWHIGLNTPGRKPDVQPEALLGKLWEDLLTRLLFRVILICALIINQLPIAELNYLLIC